MELHTQWEPLFLNRIKTILVTRLIYYNTSINFYHKKNNKTIKRILHIFLLKKNGDHNPDQAKYSNQTKYKYCWIYPSHNTIRTCSKSPHIRK